MAARRKLRRGGARVDARPLKCDHCGNRDLWTESTSKGWRHFRCSRCGKLTHRSDAELPPEYR